MKQYCVEAVSERRKMTWTTQGVKTSVTTNNSPSPTKTINQLQMSLTTNNSPSQDFTNQDDQPTTNVTHNQQQSLTGLHQPRRSTTYKCHSQPTTVLHRTSPTKTINQLQTYTKVLSIIQLQNYISEGPNVFSTILPY